MRASSATQNAGYCAFASAIAAPSCLESYSCSTLRSIFDVNTQVQFHFVGSMKIRIEIISEKTGLVRAGSRRGEKHESIALRNASAAGMPKATCLERQLLKIALHLSPALAAEPSSERSDPVKGSDLSVIFAIIGPIGNLRYKEPCRGMPPAPGRGLALVSLCDLVRYPG
jgi:hypothetical protein